MKFGKEDVQAILKQFDAGFQPIEILNGLYPPGFSEWLELAAVEQCLRENGRQISNKQPTSNADHGHQESHSAGHASSSSSNPSASASTNHAAAAAAPPGPLPAAAANNLGAHQVSAYAAVQNTTTTTTTHHAALYDPGLTLTWSELADRFTMSAHRCGKSVDEIWATLRRNGYDIAKTEVIASLYVQGVVS